MGGNVKVDGRDATPFSVFNCKPIDIIEMMYDMSKQFAQRNGEAMLFDKHINLDMFTGSSAHFISSNIPAVELETYKPTFGDMDIQTHYSYKSRFENMIDQNVMFGYYIPVGKFKHGNEISVIMQRGYDYYQFDFQFVDDPGSTNQQFLHSAAWEDIKMGFKGAHHKLLLNAVGLDDWKFSIVNGLVSRIYGGTGITNPKDICGRLFGQASLYTSHRVNSYVGLCELIKSHIPTEKHDNIFAKFIADSRARIKDEHSNDLAIIYLAKALGEHLSVG